MEHDEYDLIEEEFNEALAISLSPRGPSVLFDVIAGLSLGAGAIAVDVGCGEGIQALELATRFNFDVLGILTLPCLFDGFGDAILHNSFEDNGSYGHQTNGDIAVANLENGHPTSCYRGNVDPAGLTTRAHDTVSNAAIIIMSSCSRLWQWKTYLPQ